MKNYKDTFLYKEKIRQGNIKKSPLFSKEAIINGSCMNREGIYVNPNYCLNDNFTHENIYYEFRDKALKYFNDRKIKWHKPKETKLAEDKPDNHMCCSQSFCVNTLFYFFDKPIELNILLNQLGFDSKEILPFCIEKPFYEDNPHYICFEWNGIKNYLKEIHNGIIIKDEERIRGEFTTNADFSIRYKDSRDKINIILGEWKYTEKYTEERSYRSKKYRYDRVYKRLLNFDDCPIKLYKDLDPLDIFDEPFYQLMRLQLLAREIEEEEIEAEKAHVLLILPKENTDYSNSIISNKLQVYVKTVQDLWQDFVSKDKFKYIYTEDLINSINDIIPSNAWTQYLNLRYKWWK